jgi:hypothetical protein
LCALDLGLAGLVLEPAFECVERGIESSLLLTGHHVAWLVLAAHRWLALFVRRS